MCCGCGVCVWGGGGGGDDLWLIACSFWIANIKLACGSFLTASNSGVGAVVGGSGLCNKITAIQSTESQSVKIVQNCLAAPDQCYVLLVTIDTGIIVNGARKLDHCDAVGSEFLRTWRSWPKPHVIYSNSNTNKRWSSHILLAPTSHTAGRFMALIEYPSYDCNCLITERATLRSGFPWTRCPRLICNAGSSRTTLHDNEWAYSEFTIPML